MERIDLYGENILLNKQDTSDLNLESFLVLTLAALMGYISGLFVNGKKCISFGGLITILYVTRIRFYTSVIYILIFKRVITT